MCCQSKDYRVTKSVTHTLVPLTLLSQVVPDSFFSHFSLSDLTYVHNINYHSETSDSQISYLWPSSFKTIPLIIHPHIHLNVSQITQIQHDNHSLKKITPVSWGQQMITTMCGLKNSKSLYTSPNISTIRAIPLDQCMRFSQISTESNIVYKLM